MLLIYYPHHTILSYDFVIATNLPSRCISAEGLHFRVLLHSNRFINSMFISSADDDATHQKADLLHDEDSGDSIKIVRLTLQSSDIPEVAILGGKRISMARVAVFLAATIVEVRAGTYVFILYWLY